MFCFLQKNDGIFHGIYCCEQATLDTIGSCAWSSADFGEKLSCPALEYLRGICGSGQYADCHGSAHQVQCEYHFV